jgi:C1A family cysteine protease
MKKSVDRIKRRNPIWYGWIPDLPDLRDVLYRAMHRLPTKLPPKVDLRAYCPPVENQGSLGSCTANALVGALEFLELKHNQPLVTLSRLFVYYNERVIEHTTSTDAGAMLRDGIKSLAAQGVCPEELWPYRIKQFAKKPPTDCYRQAKPHTITSYQRLSTVEEMRACLADGFPFVFGFSVYEGFESATVAKSGVMEMPKPHEKLVGGHAVCAVGYDDQQKRFIVRNSWGKSWGKQGYFTMPYAYLDPSRKLAGDFWTVRKER